MSGKKSFTRMLLVPESQFKKLLNGSENTEKATISSVNVLAEDDATSAIRSSAT